MTMRPRLAHYRRFRPVLRAIRGNMLRMRLLVGTLSTLVILLAAGLYSIHSLQRLDDQIGGFLHQNFRLAQTMESVKEASGEMSASFVFRLAEEDGESADLYERNVARLEEARERIDEGFAEMDDEIRERLEALAIEVDTLLAAAEGFFAADASDARSEDLIANYAGELSPMILEITALADAIQGLNEERIAGRTDSSREVTLATVRFLLFAMIVATVLTLFFAYRLTYSILRPLRRLTAAVRQLGRGNLDHEIPVFSRDEIGALATSLNRMTASLKQYQERTAEKLVRLHRTMEMTLATFPHPVFILGAARTLEFQNGAGKKILREHGLSECGRLPDPLDSRIERAVRENRHFNPYKLTEALNFEIDGRSRFFIPRILLLRENDREIFGVALVLEDVTNLRLLDEMKTNLVSTVSHELKTPLTGIRMSLHMLAERSPPAMAEADKELLMTAYEDTEKLYHILNNLLDLTRVEESGAPLNPCPWESRESLSRIVEKAVALYPECDVSVDLDVDAELPALCLDPERVEHVFLNLLTNALKHSAPGGRVLVKGCPGENGFVRFSVIDTGPGIAPEHAERVFQKFYRVPDQNRSGAGLGLSIARKLTELHGGRIGLHSEPGKGSEFFVEFPVGEPADAATRAAVDDGAGTGAARSGRESR